MVSIEVKEGGILRKLGFEGNLRSTEDRFLFFPASIDVFSMGNFPILFSQLFLGNILLDADFEWLLKLFALDEGRKFIGCCIILFEFGNICREPFEDCDGLDNVGR